MLSRFNASVWSIVAMMRPDVRYVRDHRLSIARQAQKEPLRATIISGNLQSLKAFQQPHKQRLRLFWLSFEVPSFEVGYDAPKVPKLDC